MSGVEIIMSVEWLVWRGWVQTEGRNFKICFLLNILLFLKKYSLHILPKITDTMHILLIISYKLSEVPQGHDKMLGLR